ncbi:hypothetical protein MTO96_022996 [Rhipicephalus appendiculatus]
MHSVYDCWIPALIENETLEELRIPLTIFQPPQWALLFRALPTKENLKVHIENSVYTHQHLSFVCAELKSGGLEEKVSIGCYDFEHEIEPLLCKAFAEVNFSQPNERTVAALRLLPSCEHITSVTISIHRDNVAVSSAFAEFLESTTALRKLHLSAGLGSQVEGDGDTRWWSLVHEALPRNNSLRDLSVTLYRTSVQEMEELADSVGRSSSIRWVSIEPQPTTDASAFVRRFAKDIEQNHILLTLICQGHIRAVVAGHWHTVQETTRRNSGVVARAARLLKASPLDRYVSGALQRIMPHPALLTEVAELVKMDESELVNLIRDRLRVLETLDGFMKLAGVVKERVVCHASGDGCVQLDALNEDCWRHVRRYLFIDDVKEGIGLHGKTLSRKELSAHTEELSNTWAASLAPAVLLQEGSHTTSRKPDRATTWTPSIRKSWPTWWTAQLQKTKRVKSQTSLSVMNNLLLGSKIELREHPDTLGQLHLDHSGCTTTIESFDALQLPHNPELLVWLLRTHRCISSANLELSLVNNSGLATLDALRGSSGIKKLKLCFFGIGAMNAASQVLPCLTDIEELHCTSILTSGFLFPEAFIDAISNLLKNSSSLHTLRLNTFSVQAHVADTFFTTLSRQSTLTQLNLHKCLLDCNTHPYALTVYLATTTLLKVLVVDMTNEWMQMAVLEGVSNNRSIETLTIGRFIGSERSTATVAGVISNNQVIRKLSISTRDYTEPEMYTFYHCWVLPLIENETLEEIYLPLLILHPSQWAVFFDALRAKRNLKKVYIDAKSDPHHLLSLVCAKIKSSGSEEKISMGCLHFTHDFDFLQCKAFSGVQFLRAEDLTVTALSILPNCHHLTTVIMNIKGYDRTISFALAEFLQSAKSLRRLQLCVWPGDHAEAYGESPCWSLVLEALPRNEALRELSVTMYGMSVRDTDGLADSILRSPSITWVSVFHRPTSMATELTRRLAKGIAKNRTLLTVIGSRHVDADVARDWLTVQKATRRNSGVVARAARLLKASVFDRYVVAALDRVTRHPALLAEVA